MTVQILLGHKDIKINRADQLGFTPLMRAAQGNHHAAIAELLTHPAIALNQRNISGMSALLLAVERGHIEAVQQLLSVPGINIEQALLHNRESCCFSMPVWVENAFHLRCIVFS